MLIKSDLMGVCQKILDEQRDEKVGMLLLSLADNSWS